MATRTADKKPAGGMLRIKLTSGLVGKLTRHRKVVRALGLGRFGSEVEHADSPTIRGMVRKVSHLVTVTSAGESKRESSPKT